MGCLDAVADGQFSFAVNGLAAAADLPQAVRCVWIASRDVTALFKSVRNSSRVLPIAEPVGELQRGLAHNTCNGRGIRPAKAVERVGHLGILLGSGGVDDLPEGLTLGRRGFGV